MLYRAKLRGTESLRSSAKGKTDWKGWKQETGIKMENEPFQEGGGGRKEADAAGIQAKAVL